MTNFGILIIRNNTKYFIKTNMFEYFADPFILSENENSVILIVERYSRVSKLGSIISIHLTFTDDNIIKIERKNLISEKFHLSFPCIYKVFNKTFIVPETASINSLLLYEINEDGTKILRKNKIADGFFVDPVFYKNNNEIYLMWYNGISNNDGKNLCCLVDEFPINKPIEFKTIKECSLHRNAGRVIYPNYKPSQNSTGKYGKGLHLEKIIDFNFFASYQNDISLQEFLKYKIIFQNSHHVDILGSTIVFDFSYDINFIHREKDILNNLEEFRSDINFIYL